MKLVVVTQWVEPLSVRLRDNPTWLKPSQQARSEPACYSSNGVYEAGCSVSAGCVIEPRNRYGRGP